MTTISARQQAKQRNDARIQWMTDKNLRDSIAFLKSAQRFGDCGINRLAKLTAEFERRNGKAHV